VSETQVQRSLRQVLEDAEPVYLLPEDDVAELVISPALEAARNTDIMIGFFSSAALRDIAPGLAQYLRGSAAPLRLIISPYLSSEDRLALEEGTRTVEDLSAALLLSEAPDADTIEAHTLRCLAWMTRSGRLEIKLAFMRDALFHSKVWLFRDEFDSAVLHGSANMTGAGLGRNREQLALARAWLGGDAARTCDRLAKEFSSLWHGGDKDCRVLDLPDAISKRLVAEFRTEHPPDEADFKRLWRLANGLPSLAVEDVPTAGSKRAFTIPQWLNYRSGDYAHQGAAVDAWVEAGWRGILEMCTGSGKTLTAMIGAQHLHEVVGPLLIVVAAPYTVLVRQWCGEIELFGLSPIDLTLQPGPKGREQAIADARRRLRMGLTPAEVLVVSIDTLCTQEFIEQITEYEGPKLLIADECHNLGAAGFAKAPPIIFDYRLGLSATPVRQYDEEGTAFLFDYFGPSCFSFQLEQAIGRCLTPYDYFVHFVALSDDEMSEWRDLTDQIGRLAWKIETGIDDAQLNLLLLRRRRVLETAGGKLRCLGELLDVENLRDIRYTLIYATDKDPEQLKRVNDLLNARDLLFHQLTSEETSDKTQSQRILSRFQAGELQILTAKRVLDEGVNVPQIERAYILASTTVRRQWVQRRGRLLRTCKEIGKTHAIIHDLVALPPEAYDGQRMDPDARKVVRSELDRVWEFARLSRNGARSGGPFEQVERLKALLRDGE
jgi:superfamily II DNA or RNA helicase